MFAATAAKRSDAGERTTMTRLNCYRPGSLILSLNLHLHRAYKPADSSIQIAACVHRSLHVPQLIFALPFLAP